MRGYCSKGHPIIGKNAMKWGHSKICAFCRREWDRERKRKAKIDGK